MPAQVTLEQDGYLLHYVFSDPWTIAEMERVNTESLGYYNAAKHKLHVLVDMRGSKNAPTGMMRARNNPDLKHPNSGKIAVVGVTPLIRNVGEALLKLAHFNRAAFFDDMEAALEYLRKEIANEQARLKAEEAQTASPISLA
jgi:hypothetical protein